MEKWKKEFHKEEVLVDTNPTPRGLASLAWSWQSYTY